jgi:hypothetical protein
MMDISKPSLNSNFWMRQRRILWLHPLYCIYSDVLLVKILYVRTAYPGSDIPSVQQGYPSIYSIYDYVRLDMHVRYSFVATFPMYV